MNVERYICHRLYEEIEINDTAEYIVYLRQCHYQVKTVKLAYLSSCPPKKSSRNIVFVQNRQKCQKMRVKNNAIGLVW